MNASRSKGSSIGFYPGCRVQQGSLNFSPSCEETGITGRKRSCPPRGRELASKGCASYELRPKIKSLFSLFSLDSLDEASRCRAQSSARHRRSSIASHVPRDPFALSSVSSFFLSTCSSLINESVGEIVACSVANTVQNRGAYLRILTRELVDASLRVKSEHIANASLSSVPFDCFRLLSTLQDHARRSNKRPSKERTESQQDFFQSLSRTVKKRTTTRLCCTATSSLDTHT